ncbi:MAG: SseB family protein [Gemmobacter sp.]|nr:SseB family protein [Gemmobacter sp.]
MTALDTAFATMLAAPDDDAARLRYYERLSDGELFLLLQDEAEGANMTPRLFPLEDGPVVLAFDLEERLGSFTGVPSPYAALPGRVIAAQLAGQGIGLGVNLGTESAWIVTPEAIDWLAETLTHGPEEAQAVPQSFHAPGGLPQALLTALDAKLGRTGGLASGAVLAGVVYDDGRRGHMLAYLDAAPGAETALARAASEALTFSGVEAGQMDVAFLSATEPAALAMLRAGLRFDLPPPPRAVPAAPKAPGMDPDRPPRLR